MKKLKIVMAAAVLLVALIEVFGPFAANAYVKHQINKRYPDCREVSVSMKARPAIKFAFRRYDSAKISVSNITLQGANFNRIVLESDDWPSGRFQAHISAERIATFFSFQNSYITDLGLSLAEDEITVTGMIGAIRISAAGSLAIDKGREVMFVPRAVSVEGTRNPEQEAARVMEIMNSAPVFSARRELPFLLTSTAIKENELVIDGIVNLESALNMRL